MSANDSCPSARRSNERQISSAASAWQIHGDGLRASSAGRRTASVTTFLQCTLADGRISVSELETKARTAGLLGDRQRVAHSKGFKRAKMTLRIQSVRDGFGVGGQWFWVLPAPAGPPIAKPAYDQLTRAAALATYAETDPSHSIVVPTDAWRPMSTGREFRNPGRVPPEWIKGLQYLEYLDPRNVPKDVPPHRWRQFLTDCDAFLYGPERWAARAAQLGWQALDLFGFHRNGALAYLGSAGLLWLVAGGTVTKLYWECTFIDSAGGSQQVFNRRVSLANVVLPWRLP
jgi:hypothetical protein